MFRPSRICKSHASTDDLDMQNKSPDCCEKMQLRVQNLHMNSSNEGHPIAPWRLNEAIRATLDQFSPRCRNADPYSDSGPQPGSRQQTRN